MADRESPFDAAVADLRRQGLSVTIHNPSNNTWYIKDQAIFLGYVATGDELVELKRTNRLNFYGVKTLG